MLPIGISLEQYNILREWCVECNATISVKVDNINREISIYTDKPGHMIGCRGKTIQRYQKKLNDANPYENHHYKVLIFETTMNISPNSPFISEKEYLDDFNDYMEDRFGGLNLL